MLAKSATAEQRGDLEPALLNCEAKPSCGSWVPHVYTGRRAVHADDGALLAYEEIYACTSCGHERRWGLVHPEQSTQEVEHTGRRGRPRIRPKEVA